jgi:hypothetical protein
MIVVVWMCIYVGTSIWIWYVAIESEMADTEGAQPQIPLSKNRKRVKLVSVCALTQQQIWKRESEEKESDGAGVCTQCIGYCNVQRSGLLL